MSPDSIRLALHGQRFIPSAEPTVWATAHLMVDALFLAGHDTVVVDSTNVSTKRREEWTRRIGDVYDEVKLQVFDTPPDECKRRAVETGREDLIPVIDRMAGEWDLQGYWKLGLPGVLDKVVGIPEVSVIVHDNPAERVVRALEDWLDARDNAALAGPSLKPDARRQLLVDALTYLATGE